MENEIEDKTVEAAAGVAMFKTGCFYSFIFMVLFLKDPDLLDGIINVLISFSNYLDGIAK